MFICAADPCPHWQTGRMPTTENPEIVIPAGLKPDDGRFGTGPSKIRSEAVQSRRLPPRAPRHEPQQPVRGVVGAVRLAACDGCSTSPTATRSSSATAARQRSGTPPPSAHRATEPAPRLRRVLGEVRRRREGRPLAIAAVIVFESRGTHPDPVADRGRTYALTHNETSTGIMTVIRRPGHSTRAAAGSSLVDATSAAGGLHVEAAEFDVYYFAPRSASAPTAGSGWRSSRRRPSRGSSDRRGGPLGAGDPRPVDRHRQLRASTRPTTRRRSPRCSCSPTSSSGSTQTAASTGQPSRSTARRTAVRVGGAVRSSPRRSSPSRPSAVPSIGTIDFASRSTRRSWPRCSAANNIVDTEPYRKLGRNQLRIAMFPGIDPDDVEALTGCIDYVVSTRFP